LPIRVFLPSNDTSGEFISRPRSIALREFGPQNIIYHNGRKYRVCQLVVQDAESALTEAKLSIKAGYFLTGDQKDLEICPFSGLNLSDAANKEHLHNLMEMAESRAEEIDRITCEEEERRSVATAFAPIFRWTAAIWNGSTRPWRDPAKASCSTCATFRRRAWCTSTGSGVLARMKASPSA
jgi:hypothetical protein